MKKTWKLVTIVLMIGLVVGMIISNSTNANEAFSVITNTTEIKLGQEVLVTLKANDGSSFYHIEGLGFKYDSSFFNWDPKYTKTNENGLTVNADSQQNDTVFINYTSDTGINEITLGFISKGKAGETQIQSVGDGDKNPIISVTKGEPDSSVYDQQISIQITIVENTPSKEEPVLDSSEVTVKVDESKEVKITNKANIGEGYTWSSDNANIATVEETTDGCKITGKSEGTTTVKLSNGTVTKTVNVTVESKETPQQLTINPTSATIAKNGTQKFELNKQGNYTWSSDNENVAKVDSTGLVTGVGAGTATITATDGTETVSATITVTDNSQPDPTPDPTPDPKPDPTPLVPTGVQIDVGKSTTVTIENKSSISGNCTWKSDNESVAKVDNNGTITGVAKGTANITVTTPTGKSATIKVTVNEVDNGDTSKPVLTPASITVPEGYTFTITSDKPVTWMIGSEGVAKIVSSDTTKATIQAVAKGKAIVIATSTSNQDAQATTSIEVIEKQVEVVDNTNNSGNVNNSGTANNGGSQGNSKTGGATTQNTSSSANEAVPATGESSVETIAILVIATLFIAAIVFRKRSRIK